MQVSVGSHCLISGRILPHRRMLGSNTLTYQTNGTDTVPCGRGTPHALLIILLVNGNQRIVLSG